MGSSKRIVCAVTNDLAQDQRMHRICSSLTRSGYDVMLVGRKKTETTHQQELPFLRKRLTCFFRSGPLFYLEFNIRLFFFMTSQAFDIGNAVDLDTLPAIRIACWFKSKHFVFDAHEWFEEVPELSGMPVRKFIWYVVARIFLFRSRYNYTVNQSLAEILGQRYRVSFQVIHNFPEFCDQKELGRAVGKPIRLIYQGMLNKGRGLEKLLDVIREIPNVEFILAGHGDLWEKIKDQIEKDAILSRKAKLKGFVDPDELKQLTQSCHIGFNLLDRTSKSYFYSLANKYFDYIMAGIPCICSDFPEYRRFNSRYETSILISDLNQADLLHSIQKLLSDPPLFTGLQENCRLAAKEFNWEQEEQKLIDLYHRVSRSVF